MRRAWLLASKALEVEVGVGCVITDIDSKIVGEGCNRTSIDSKFLFNRADKRRFVIHAEVIALLSASPGGINAYCTLAPCFDCLKLLSFCGIQRVVYDDLLGRNKEFSDEKFELFELLIKETKITFVNRSDIPFLHEISTRTLP